MLNGVLNLKQSIKFETLVIQAGSDSTGVATDMISLNSTIKFNFRNTATFFGVHVASTPIDLSYSDIVIGTGNVSLLPINFNFQFCSPLHLDLYFLKKKNGSLQMHKFYQSRKTQKTVTVSVIGNKIPLYGSGASLSTPKGTTTMPVPLHLNFKIRSRAYVLGKLVKPKFYKEIKCDIIFDPKKLNVPISLKNSCTYN